MKRITFGSICSGIEAASVAWLPLGFEALWLSEIEPYPCRVLAQRFPETSNLGDITDPDFPTRAAQCGKPDIIVGGTPCQAFSVAGLRRGLADERGNLTLRYVEICNAIGPTVCVWENVPGVLSSTDNAFGCFLGALVGADWPFEPGPRPAVGKSTRLWRWHRSGRRHLPRWPGAGFCVGPQRRAAWRILERNISECPNGAVASSLWHVLEPPGSTPPRYFLSAKACAGILRRADRRGRQLPEPLRRALEAQARRNSN